MTKKPVRRDPIRIIILCLLIPLGLLVWIAPWDGIFMWLPSIVKKQQHVVSDTFIPTPSPTPIQLHKGVGAYNVSHGKTNGPIISKIIFSPLDVHKDEKFIISVELRSNKPITSITGTLQTDISNMPLNFVKIGEAAGLQTWSTERTMTDTLWYSYILTVKAVNATGETIVTVAPRS